MATYDRGVSRPHVSVVVPSRGGVSRLPALLDALRSQEGPSWEAVVVVDGDVDGSATVLSRAAEQLPVRPIVFDENRGRSAALNAGFEAARGDVLVRCDDDLVPGPRYLARHAAAHEHAPRGVVGLYRNVYPETTYARVYGRDWDRRFRAEAYAAPADRAWQFWAGNVSVNRRTWDLVGPYDTQFRAYGWEDVDWGYRLHQAGIPVVLDQGLETEHRIAATTTAVRAQRAYYSGAAKRLFETKHGLGGDGRANDSRWDRLVSAVADRSDERRSQRLGDVVDRAARLLPPTVARKAVALAVESSSRAGYAAGAAGRAI